MKRKSANENDLGSIGAVSLDETEAQFARAYGRRAGEPIDVSETEIIANIARAIGADPSQLARVWKPARENFSPGIEQGGDFAAVELRLRLTLKWQRL